VDLDRWQRTEALFHEALERDEGDRPAFLDGACGDDAELRRDVERLLTADGAAAVRLGSAVGDAVRSLHEPSLPGQRIGVYEIVERLGEGGMGRVYHARRNDGVFHKDVAIKIVKPGLDSAAILRRFHRERRILARLEHPSIVGILDGGSTDQGVPYLVMDYVDGLSLPEYASHHHLNLRARLRLFAQVCEAVQYAHDRQIVHRDLKPGNILVDASGRPRLLDFGIATLIGADDRPLAITATGSGLMTPGYASPEQVRGAPVTPASDIYSLGVILYELLTGCAAHQLASDSPAAIVKAVCEDETIAPSAAARAAQEAGRAVPIDPGELNDAIDRIVLRAVAKDPERRHPSAEAMAAEVNRLCESQSVVSAPRPTTVRWRRFVRGHRTATTAFLFLVIALGVTASYLVATRRHEVGRASSGKIMLAVLPLENLTGDNERVYFVDGLHEEIISRLGRLQPSRLGVIARTSVLQYRGTSKAIAEIGRELGADYILEGSVREAGTAVRVTAQLIQVKDQTHLWAETYDRTLQDLFNVQSEIGAHVADSLAVDVLPHALATIEAPSQLPPDAYAAYLRGRYLWNRRTVNYPSNVQQAADDFQAVTIAAPKYAPGFASLGQTLSYLARYSPQRLGLVEQARAAASRALALDDGSATALATLAGIRRQDRDWIGAEQGFQLALSKDPNNPDIHQEFATMLAYGGRREDARREIQTALSLDPLSPSLHDAAFYIYLGIRQWDLAREMAARLGRLAPNDSTSIVLTSLWFALRDNCGAALEEMRKLEARRREIVEAEVSFFEGYVSGRCVSAEDGARFARELEENLDRNPVALAFTIAEVWAGASDREKVIQWLEESDRRRETFLPWAAIDPTLDPFRDDPRFQALLRRMNYPTQWGANTRQSAR
jgi:eukaryotic-like serine/threonine-protein kinase